jgi:hypothetical protein
VQSARTSTSGVVDFLTSLRVSGAASRRRGDDGGENPTAAALGFRRHTAGWQLGHGISGRASPGAAAAYKGWANRLGVQATRGWRVEHGLRGGGESDSGASPAGTREVGDDRWGPPVIGCARGKAARRAGGG